MWSDLLSCLGARDVHTSWYQVSNPEDFDFLWEDPELNVDAVFQPGIDTFFPRSNFNDFEMGSMAKNPILVDEK